MDPAIARVGDAIISLFDEGAQVVVLSCRDGLFVLVTLTTTIRGADARRYLRDLMGEARAADLLARHGTALEQESGVITGIFVDGDGTIDCRDLN